MLFIKSGPVFIPFYGWQPINVSIVISLWRSFHCKWQGPPPGITGYNEGGAGDPELLFMIFISLYIQCKPNTSCFCCFTLKASKNSTTTEILRITILKLKFKVLPAKYSYQNVYFMVLILSALCDAMHFIVVVAQLISNNPPCFVCFCVFHV